MESKKNKKASKLAKSILIGSGVGAAVGIAVAGSALAIASDGIAAPVILASLAISTAILEFWSVSASLINDEDKKSPSLAERLGNSNQTTFKFVLRS